MNDFAVDPTETHQIFEHQRVADGYASARPFLHPEVFARVRDLIRPPAPFRRALDVGCGTGLSSVALLGLAREVTGADVSVPMLTRARKAENLHYLASSAEDLPFRAGSFDLVTVCGAIDWVDRERFLPRASELLTEGGWLVPLDFGDTGRSVEVPGLERWHQEVFQERFPRPPSSDPMVAGAEAARFGFGAPETHTFELRCSFAASRYVDFLMTESNVIAAVEYGDGAAEPVRAWLELQIGPLFGRAEREVLFGGYIQLMRRL